MLEVSSSLRSPSSKAADHQLLAGSGFVGEQHVVFPTSAGSGSGSDDFIMVDDNLLLEFIDFSCCDVPLFDADDGDMDILPDLEVDPTEELELLAEFSSSRVLQDEAAGREKKLAAADEKNKKKEDEAEKLSSGTTTSTVTPTTMRKGVTTTEEEDDSAGVGSSASGHGKKKASAAGDKNSSNGGKRKVKVDWTPELHRRFVQAVEQLGIDKAVPSRILEIIGIEGLTRHNIASHLQKYRSHRKHLMAREAEAATWAQKRHHHMYAPASARVVPTIGFPPPPFCRPLHVWGHPPTAGVEAAPPTTTMLPVWPRHLAPPRPWAPVDPAAYWQHHHQYNAARKWGPHHAAAVTPAMVQQQQQQLPRFPVPHPATMYRPACMVPPPPTTTSTKLADLQLHLDAHPSKESIDAAIGDVLVKPWLPLPLGLKPPSMDSVMSELHKQGIPEVPPSSTSSG